MHNPMEFDVKINYKIKESQDNANRISNFKKSRLPYSVGQLGRLSQLSPLQKENA